MTVKIIDKDTNPYTVLGEHETRAEADQARAEFEAAGHKYLLTSDPTSTWTIRDRMTGQRQTFSTRWGALEALIGIQDSTGHTVDLYENTTN